MALTRVHTISDADLINSSFSILENNEHNWIVSKTLTGYRVYDLQFDGTNYTSTTVGDYEFGTAYDGITLTGNNPDDGDYRENQLVEINGSIKFIDVTPGSMNVFSFDQDTGDMTLESSTDITGPGGAYLGASEAEFEVFPYDDGTGFRVIWETVGNTPTRTISYNQDGSVQDGPVDIAPENSYRAAGSAEVDDGNGGTVHFYIAKSEVGDQFLISEVDLVSEETPTPLPVQSAGGGSANGNITTLRIPQSDGGPDRTFVYVARQRNLEVNELFSDGSIVYLDTYSLGNTGNGRFGADIYEDGDGNFFGIHHRGSIIQFNEDGSITPPPSGRARTGGADRGLSIDDTLHIAHQTTAGNIEIYQSDTPAVEPIPASTDPVDCFTRGTLIATDRGEVAIEDLREGDMVLTMDDGYQPIRWIGVRKVTNWAFQKNPKLRPIRISAGAMGLNLPQQDLVVSRQHRMLVKSRISARMFDAPEVLVSAIKLCAMPGIYVDESVKQVEYFHMLFDCHQMVYANGTPSESLFTGPQALKALSAEAREEIETLFPEICAPDFEPTAAREIPEGKRQKKLMERHLKSSNQLLMA